MSESRSSVDAQVDFLDVISTIWRAKWTALGITAAFMCVGWAYSFYSEESYRVTTPINIASASVFNEFMQLDEIISEINNQDYSNDASSGNRRRNADDDTAQGIVNSEYVFEKFITEFNDYQEMVAVLESSADLSSYGNSSDQALSPRKISTLAKKFKITPPAKADGQWVASFEWHDVDEGKELFGKAIDMVLQSTKAAIVKDIEKISDLTERTKLREIESLQADLDILLNLARVEKAQRLEFLRMNASIARELGIENGNQAVMGQQSGDQGVILTEAPLYLRGFKAIEKEIALTEALSDEQIILSNDEERRSDLEILASENYSQTLYAIEKVKADNTAARISDFLDTTVKNADTSNWIKFNIFVADGVSRSIAPLFLAVATIFGFMVAIIYVLGSNELRKRKLLRERDGQLGSV